MMDKKIFIAIFNILACASCLNFGGCSVDVSNILIHLTTNDKTSVRKEYPTTGEINFVVLEDLHSAENGALYISAEIEPKNLIISTTESFFDLEENTETHQNGDLQLEKTIRLVCQTDGEKEDIVVLLDVTDTNNHIPSFSAPSYDFKLPKDLMADVDLTTSDEANPIIVEDKDFSNTDITFTVVPGDTFEVEAIPLDDGRRKFRGALKVKHAYTITETTQLKVTATDNGEPQRSKTVYVTISSPSSFGECTINDNGKLEYGFFEGSTNDNETFKYSIDYTGELTVQTTHDDTGSPYITVEASDNKLTFKTSDYFEKYFDDDHISENRQPTITIYRRVKIICKDTEQGFTFALVVKDTNNHAPEFTQETYEYILPEILMPTVDLTSLGDPIIVKDVDFSNTDITFTATADSLTFVMETVYEETEENKRLYRGILRVPSYTTLTSDPTIVTIKATDNGNPPRWNVQNITIKIDPATKSLQ